MRIHFNPSRLKPGRDKLMKSSALKAERLHLIIFNKLFFSFMTEIFKVLYPNIEGKLNVKIICDNYMKPLKTTDSAVRRFEREVFERLN